MRPRRFYRRRGVDLCEWMLATGMTSEVLAPMLGMSVRSFDRRRSGQTRLRTPEIAILEELGFSPGPDLVLDETTSKIVDGRLPRQRRKIDKDELQ